MFDIHVPEDHWHLPYGDDDKDIYKENALRANTLDEEIKSKGWKGVVLKNHSGDYSDNAIENIHPSYESISDLIQTYKKFKGKWTLSSELAYDVKEWIEENLNPYFVVGHAYVLSVEPHGFIKEHRDIPANYDPKIHKNFNTLNTFMAPLNDPAASYFILNKKQIELKKGKVTWFNSSLPHVYFNTSNDTKYFLLFTGLARKKWIETTVGNILNESWKHLSFG